MQNNIDIYEQIKIGIKNFPFLFLKNEILGEDYSLSVSILSEKSAKKLNIDTRKQDYIPNTLSFINSPSSGEIILQPDEIKRQSKDFNMSYTECFLFMYIHSLLHLKNLEHGEEMEKQEVDLFEKYRKNLNTAS
jgi:probable rRNA maturation factor